MFRKCFAILVVVFFLMGTFASQASADIGTHLGEGDQAAQANIILWLSEKMTDTAGFPVTIQVSVNTPESNMRLIADAVARTGFFPIIRVNGACDANATSEAVNTISRIRSAFGADVVIEWGNEINNRVVECSTPANFESSYSQVKNLGVGPSALDYYHGEFGGEAVALASSSLYAGAPYYFANAYGCMGEESGNCNPSQTQTQKQGYEPVAGKGAPFYLTEFSLSPGGSEPDKNLRNVVNFIESRAAETGAVHTTPLIRNVCNSESRWLVFLSKSRSKSGKSEIYTARGTRIDIDSCAGTSSEQDDYFLYPLPAFSDNTLTGNDRINAIMSELLQQGYQAQCLSPQIDVRAMVDGLPGYLYPQISQESTLEAAFSQDTDLSEGKIPAWRMDGTNDITVVNSLETLFGYKDATDSLGLSADDDLLPGSQFESSILYRTLDSHQLCMQQSRILDTQRNMCNKLKEPETCALNQPIKESEETILSLQQKIDGYISQYLDQAGGDREIARNYMCKDVVSESNDHTRVHSALGQAELEKVQSALSNTPLYISNAYRVGFLVLAATLEGESEEPTDGRPFRFMRTHTDRTVIPLQEIRIFAFRIPDIGTNKDPNSDIYYKDPLDLVRESELSQQAIDKLAEDYQVSLTTPNVNNQFTTANFPLSCYGEESMYCVSDVAQAFLKYINTFLRAPSNVGVTTAANIQNPVRESDAPFTACRLDPSELPAQDITRIFSSAKIAQAAGRLQAGNVDTYVNLQENGISQSFPTEYDDMEDGPGPSEGRQSWPFNFITEAKVRQDGEPKQAAGGETLEIHSYLIVPQGFYLAATEDTIAGRWLSASQKEQFYQAFEPDLSAEEYLQSILTTAQRDQFIAKYDPSQPETLMTTLVNLLDDEQKLAFAKRYGREVNYIDEIATGEKPPENPFGKLLRFFKIEGVKQGIETNIDATGIALEDGSSFSITDPLDCGPSEEDPRRQVCQQYTVSLKHESQQTDSAPRIHGGVLGELMLVVQKVLSGSNTDRWRYIDGCKTIEDFIMGTCEAKPIAQTDANQVGNTLEAIAQCDGGKRTTSGETAVNMIAVSKGQKVEYTFPSTGNTVACMTYVSGPNYQSYATPEKDSFDADAFADQGYHNISRWRDPSDLPAASAQEYCESMYEFVACTYPETLIQNRVNAQGQWDSNGAETACEYVVRRAQEKGVSPRFAMAMWGEESGFSHYRNASAFGVISKPALDLGAQVESFLNTVIGESYTTKVAAHSNTDPNNPFSKYLDFLEQYSGEVRGSNQFCRNNEFPARIKTFYNFAEGRQN